MTTELWRQYLTNLFQKEDADKLRSYDALTSLFETGKGTDIPGVRGTAWGAYNAITEYCKDKGSIDSVLFGTYDGLIKQAHLHALTL